MAAAAAAARARQLAPQKSPIPALCARRRWQLPRCRRGLSGAAASAPAAKKVIIDTDPGCDDAMAFVCAIHSGSVGGTVAGRAVAPLDVIGLTSIFGNVHTELATANALRLVELGI